MGLWALKGLGIGSKDFVDSGDSPQKDLYGNKWKFEDGKSHDSALLDQKRSIAEKSVDSSVVTNPISKASVIPVEKEELETKPKVTETEPSKYTQGQLSKLSREEITQIAAGAGVTNLSLTKGKLIEAILAKQG